ncbi:hypothetical protein BH09PSE5_BH09PSE5_37910 [soil metagenome]
MSQSTLFAVAESFDIEPAEEPAVVASAAPVNTAIPASVAAHIWRGNEMGGRSTTIVSSGFKPLDRELPGGGWPCQALTEVLVEPQAHCEWRLLAPTLKRIQKRGDTVFLIGPPYPPHLPGLKLMGIDERRLIWIRADSPRERLWATQQIIQSGQAGAVMAWLPGADARALRRLQACSLGCEAPIFVLRPVAMRQENSPAPLRVEVTLGDEPWSIRLQVVKRRGPQLEQPIELPSVPGGLTQILARRSASTASRRAAVPVPANSQEPRSLPTPPRPNPLPLPRPIPIPIPLPLLFQPPPQPSPATSQEPIDDLLAGALLPFPLRAIAQ